MKTQTTTTAAITTLIAAYVSGALLADNLYYHASHSLFTYDWRMVTAAFASPGGFGEYMAAFLVQFFAVRWLGAVVFALFAAGSYLLVDRVLRYWGRDCFNLAMVLPLAATAMFASAEFSFAGWMSVVFVVALVWIWQKLPAVFGVIFGAGVVSILYPLVGEWFWLFPLMVVLALLLKKGLSEWNWITVALSIFMPLFWAFPYFRIVHYSVDNLLIITLVYFTLAVLSARFSLPKGRVIITIVSSAAIIFGCGYLFVNKYDVREKLMIRIDRALDERDWEEVLDIAARYPVRNILTTYAANVALLNRGELVERVFEFPQHLGEKGLFIGRQGNNRENEFISHIYASLGMYNEALHQSWEAMTNQGYNVSNLKHLILYNHLVGRDEIARKFNSKLSKTLFYSDFYDTIKNEDYYPPFTCNPRNRFNNPSNLTSDLAYIVANDPANRRAGEAFLVSLLLANRLIIFGENVALLKRLYPNELPAIFEQALMILRLRVKDDEFAKLGIEISPATQNLFNKYGAAYRASQGNSGAMSEFRNTYFYYMNFISPNGNKVVEK